jgi:hypothetical protein
VPFSPAGSLDMQAMFGILNQRRRTIPGVQCRIME